MGASVMLGITTLKLTQRFRDQTTADIYINQGAIVSVQYVERFDCTSVKLLSGVTVWVAEKPEDFMEAVYHIRSSHAVKDSAVG